MADHGTSPSTPKFDWQPKFQAALLEVDREKLPLLVAAAEAAIYLRLQSLVDSPDGRVERNALTNAIRQLRVIQKEKMDYPDWQGE